MITAADNITTDTVDPIVGFVTEYGDWGDAHMRAYGTPGWRTHIRFSPGCAEVQAAWDRQRANEVGLAECRVATLKATG